MDVVSNYEHSNLKILEIKNILLNYKKLKKMANPNFNSTINTEGLNTEEINNSLIEIKKDINRMMEELQSIH